MTPLLLLHRTNTLTFYFEEDFRMETPKLVGKSGISTPLSPLAQVISNRMCAVDGAAAAFPATASTTKCRYSMPIGDTSNIHPFDLFLSDASI